MANKAKAALTGAGTGAAAGAVLGPWGAAGGALIGGAIGYFGAGDDEKAPVYNPNRTNFTYGMGPADYNYAQNQSNSYDKRQGQLQTLAEDAYNRDAPVQAMPDSITHVGSQGQSYLQGADAESRQQQLAALGGLQGQVGALNKFAAAPMGPSAAQATLRQGQGAAMAQQLAMARAQPGGGGAALRNAAFNNAGITANVANSAAQLNAQETAQHRAQQLQALGAAQQGAGQVAGYSGQLRQGDQSFAQAQAGQANYDAGSQNQFSQGQQQLQYQVGANNLTAAGQARGQNDAFTLGALGQQQGYEVLRNQLASGAAQSGAAYENAVLASKGLASSNAIAAQQQSNTETAMMLGALSSGAGAYGQMQGGGGKPTSDVRAKKDIKPVSVLEALGGGRSPDYSAEDTKALYAQQISGEHVQNAVRDAQAARARGDFDQDSSEFRAAPPIMQGTNTPRDDRLRALSAGQGSPDFRNAQGYEYAYTDPEKNGAGRYVGPMAQDLENVPGVVIEKPGGEKAIDAPRLTLANTAAVSEQQRRLDEIERRQQLQALGGYTPGAFVRPDLKPIDYAALGPAGYHY